MNAATEFDWPKALRPVLAAAEAGTLKSRSLYPVEIKALCDLVAGAPLEDGPREIAPGTTASRRQEERTEQNMLAAIQTRVAYYFIRRFEGGTVWQCSLFTDWLFNPEPAALTLAPRNIAQALTRSKADRGQA